MTNMLKLAQKEKYEELEDYISTKLSATWLEILQVRKLFGLPVDETEEFAVFNLIDFTADIAQSTGYTKEDFLKKIGDAFDLAEKEMQPEEEEEEEEASRSPHDKLDVTLPKEYKIK